MLRQSMAQMPRSVCSLSTLYGQPKMYSGSASRVSVMPTTYSGRSGCRASWYAQYRICGTQKLYMGNTRYFMYLWQPCHSLGATESYDSN